MAATSSGMHFQNSFSGNRRHPRLQGKNFLLGVGAQRCGTTWLYEYLNGHLNVELPAIKELHYFDQIFRPDLCAYWAKKFKARLDTQLASTSAKTLTETEATLLSCLVERVRMNTDPAAYFQLFDRLVIDRTRVTGEITPSYCLVRADAFVAIRAALVRNGLEPRVIFLMRDPAQRFWSHVRFAFSRGQLGSDLDTGFRIALTNQQFLERTRYDLTIISLKSAFAANELYFDFYENLFSQNTLQAICSFLGLSPHTSAVVGRVNSSPTAELGFEKQTLLHNTFSQVYHFCETEFGSKLPSAWHRNQTMV